MTIVILIVRDRLSERYGKLRSLLDSSINVSEVHEVTYKDNVSTSFNDALVYSSRLSGHILFLFDNMICNSASELEDVIDNTDYDFIHLNKIKDQCERHAILDNNYRVTRRPGSVYAVIISERGRRYLRDMLHEDIIESVNVVASTTPSIDSSIVSQVDNTSIEGVTSNGSSSVTSLSDIKSKKLSSVITSRNLFDVDINSMRMYTELEELNQCDVPYREGTDETRSRRALLLMAVFGILAIAILCLAIYTRIKCSR